MPEARLKHGGSRKHGRNKEKCARYKGMHTRERNKLKRILRSSGQQEAERMAQKYNLDLGKALRA